MTIGHISSKLTVIHLNLEIHVRQACIIAKNDTHAPTPANPFLFLTMSISWCKRCQGIHPRNKKRPESHHLSHTPNKTIKPRRWAVFYVGRATKSNKKSQKLYIFSNEVKSLCSICHLLQKRLSYRKNISNITTKSFVPWLERAAMLFCYRWLTLNASGNDGRSF